MPKDLDPVRVAKSIIYYAREQNIHDISHRKLQKLLYLVYQQYAKRTGQPLWSLHTPWIVTSHGPVCTPVLEKFKMFMSVTITVDIEAFELYKDIPEIHDVIQQYGNRPAWDLADATMHKSSAWYTAIQNKQIKLYFSDINRSA